MPGGRDLFQLQEVERWLESRGRLNRAGRSKQLLFQAADLLRSQLSAASMTEALGAALALVAIDRRQAKSLNRSWDMEAVLAATVASNPDLEDVFQPLWEVDPRSAARVLALVLEIAEDDLPQCFEWLLTRHNQSGMAARHGSGDAQTALLVAMIEDEAGVIYDPAAGLGGFLAALWRVVDQKPQLFGQEVNAATLRIARQRFLVHDIPASMVCGDTLIDDAWPELRADVVVCDPPYQAKKAWPASADGDPRWVLGRPPAVTDFAWLQHAAHHLTEDGRAYVFLPPGSLFRGGREGALRSELLAKGVVEAIVSLPPRTALHTGIPVAMWVLRRPGRGGDRDSVLLIDATAAAPTNHVELVPRVAGALRKWRAGGGVSERDREIAAFIPVSDLLEGSATMVPARWIHQGLTETQREAQEGDFEKTLTGMSEIRRAIGSKIDIARPSRQSLAEWVPVKRLLEDGLVEVIKGTRVKAEDCLSCGVPVLRTRDIAARLGDRVEPCYIDVDALPSPALTNPGDIVLSPASGALRAVVDHNGGHVLARPLQVLRLLDGFLDPVVVAAFLESPRNRRFVTGTAYARVSLRDLELPMLAPEDLETLRTALAGLADQERLAGELVSSAQRLRHTLVNLASPGAEGESGDE